MPSLSDGVMVLYIYYLIDLNDNKRIYTKERENKHQKNHIQIR